MHNLKIGLIALVARSLRLRPWRMSGRLANGRVKRRAVSAFSAEHAESSATSTQKKYKIIMKKLKGYSDAKGYTVLAQWAPADVHEFR